MRFSNFSVDKETMLPSGLTNGNSAGERVIVPLFTVQVLNTPTPTAAVSLQSQTQQINGIGGYPFLQNPQSVNIGSVVSGQNTSIQTNNGHMHNQKVNSLQISFNSGYQQQQDQIQNLNPTQENNNNNSFENTKRILQGLFMYIKGGAIQQYIEVFT